MTVQMTDYNNRSKEIVEAALAMTSSTADVTVDESFYRSEIPTFVFINGVLKESTNVKGLTFTKSAKQTRQIETRISQLTTLHDEKLQESFDLVAEKDTKAIVRILRLSTISTLTATTLTITAKKSSDLTIIEESASLDQGNVFLGETLVTVEDGAKVDHIVVSRENSSSRTSAQAAATVAKDALYRNFIFNLSGAGNNRQLDIRIAAPGAHAESNILYLLNGSEKSVVDTVIHHLTPDSTSAQLAKGILDGESRASFTGRIHIHKDAQRVNSSQLNKNLLLSKKAQAFSEPQLEIFADDVKCSHGSTTGQLSPEEIFYFEARGIPEQKARTLLATGFAQDVVMKIADPSARLHLQDLVAQELKTKFHLGGTL